MPLWKKTSSGQGDPPGPLGKYITMYNKAVKTLGTDNPEVLKNFFASQQYGQNNAQVQQNNNINKAPQPKESKVGNIAGDVGTLALSTLQNFGMNIPGDVIKAVAPKAAILDLIPSTSNQQYLKQRNQSLGQNIKDVADAANTLAAFEVGTPLVMKGVQQGVKYLKPVVESGIDAVGNKIANTYKINPWRFKPSENASYRMLGKEGYQDAINSGILRSKNVRAYPEPFFLKGEIPDGVYSNPKSVGFNPQTGMKIPSTGYGGPYMVEAKTELKGVGAWANDADPMIVTPVDKSIYQPGVKFYKQHWLKGYKEIPKPNNTNVQFKLNDLSTGNNIKQDINFYHFSHNNNLSLKDIDVLRTGESQFKKRYLKAGIENLPSGFYTHKTKYPTFMKPGSPYEIKMPSDIKIRDLTKDGYNMSDRISKKEIMEYQKMGIDVLYGKNMIGQDEYIIINKDKIKSFTKIDKPKSIFELKNEFPGINFKGMSDYEIDNFIKNNQ